MSIEFKQVSHIYNADTPFSYAALKDVDLTIKQGKITAIIGETGSGKSTLVQHLNALLTPTSGEIQILDQKIVASEKIKDVKAIRKQVGLVFQFPEYQLFEESILKDIAFGPQNFGVHQEEAEKIAKDMLDLVGLPQDYLTKSPFDLSGGQKRRVAIAGILAMDPNVLVLDEPTAGLDPQGAKDMMSLFVKMNKEYHKTVLVVTHDMEHVLNYCDDVVVVKDGKIVQTCDVKEFFQSTKILEELNIQPPMVIKVRQMLQQKGFQLSDMILDIETLAKQIAEEVNSNE